MNKVISRLFIFFVGIPVVIGLVYLSVWNHAPLHAILTIVSCFAAVEMYDMFITKTPLLPKWLLVVCSALIPAAAFITVFFHLPEETITGVFIFDFLLVMAVEVFSAAAFGPSITRLASSLFIILYSGYLITFISRLTQFHFSIAYIAVFLLMVFFCDSFAWLFGNLLGKNNRGIVKASPNKSIAGFIGGFAGSILAGVLGYYIWPSAFAGSIWKLIILGIIIAFAAIIGDLVESVIKRSADCKDSGHIIPGRGGILDSIDSVLMAAPVYYIMLKILYIPVMYYAV